MWTHVLTPGMTYYTADTSDAIIHKPHLIYVHPEPPLVNTVCSCVCVSDTVTHPMSHCSYIFNGMHNGYDMNITWSGIDICVPSDVAK